MKYVETHVRQLAALEGEVAIVVSPDDTGVECLQVGEEHLMPFIGWMRYDRETESWTELDPEEEEDVLNHLSENCRFREVSQKEAGEKFSDDVEFLG